MLNSYERQHIAKHTVIIYSKITHVAHDCQRPVGHGVETKNIYTSLNWAKAIGTLI